MHASAPDGSVPYSSRKETAIREKDWGKGRANSSARPKNSARPDNSARPENGKKRREEESRMEKSILEYETVALDDEANAVVIIDQTLLPARTELIRLRTAQEIWDAIYLLKVRGAPAIGVAAAFGIYVLAKGIDTEDFDAFYAEFTKQKEFLNSARPTAVNLSGR